MFAKTVSRNPKDFADQLLLLKNRNKLCDATLIINGEKIYVHANVLASSCEYFGNKFVNTKSPATEVKFNNVDTEAFLLLIEYCYTGTIQISEKNAKEVISIANLLILPTIIESSCEILEKMLNSVNCLSTWKFAEKEHLENLKTVAFDFAKSNFEEVSLSQEFLSLEQSDLIEFLNSDMQVDEMVKYNSVKSWINHDSANRSNHLLDLLKLIKLICLPHYFLISESLALCKTDGTCHRKYLEVLQSQKDYDSNGCSSPSTLVTVGAALYEQSKIIEIYDAKKQEWVAFDINCNRVFFAASFVENDLMLIGGKSQQSIVNTVESYNLKSNQMITRPSMKHSRYQLSAVQYQGCVFAIGGYNDGPLSTVEKWDPKSKTWQDLAPLNIGRYVCGGAVLDNKIFILGGYNGGSLDSVEAYDSSTNKWTIRKSMNQKRYGPGVTVVGGHLYAVGGYGDTLLNTAEKYNVENDNWTLIQSLEVNKHYLAAGNLTGKLIVAGGYGKSPYPTVEMYNEENDKWTTIASLKNPRYDLFLIEVPLRLVSHLLSKKT